MFDIEYKGGTTVVITTKKARLVTDPKLSLLGLKDASIKDAVAVATEDRFVTDDPDAKLIINGPGEYETAEFSIVGIPARRHIDNDESAQRATIYRIGIGEVRIGLLGNIAPKLSEEQLESLGVLDIVIMPVGGNGYTLDATSATQLARSIEAKVVIPVHYQDPGLKYEVPQAGLEEFVKELGAAQEVTSKYKLKNAGALPASMTVVELTRS